MATTPTTATTTPPSTPVIHGPLNIDYLNESWCELQYKSGCSSTGSISHLNHSVNPEVLEKLLQEAQKETYAAASLSSLLPSDPNARNNKAPPPQPLASPNATVSPTSLIAEILSSPSSLSSMATVKTPMSSSSSTEITLKSETGSRNTHSCYVPLSHHVAEAVSAQKMCADFINSDDCCGGDEDVDLEYVDEEESSDEQSAAAKKTLHESGQSESDAIETLQCSDCLKHKKQIDSLIERQIYHEKQLIKLRKEYEEKILLNKSLIISSSSTSSSSSSSSSSSNEALLVTSLCKNSNDLHSTNKSSNTNTMSPKYAVSYSPPSLANVNTNSPTLMNSNEAKMASTHDYINYWSSRPQAQPPK